METLYRFFNKDNQLLYVGISNNWTQRLKQHYKDSEFFEQVHHATFEHFETRQEVEAAEKKAILTEGAIYNKAFNPNFETGPQHFQKIKAWVYSKIAPDEQHAGLVFELRNLFLEDPDWTSKTSGPIAFYLVEALPNWDHYYSMNCDYCVRLWSAEWLESWGDYYRKKKYNAAN